MSCEIGETTVVVGYTYPYGNINPEAQRMARPIVMNINPRAHYFSVKDGERVPMEYNPRTGESRIRNIPLL